MRGSGARTRAGIIGGQTAGPDARRGPPAAVSSTRGPDGPGTAAGRDAPPPSAGAEGDFPATLPGFDPGAPGPTTGPPAEVETVAAAGHERQDPDRDTGREPERQPEPAERASDPDPWQRWLASPAGRYLLEWQQTQLDTAVADVFGYHAVQCGQPAIDALRANRMPHRVAALLPDEPSPAHDRPRVRVEHFEELPFETQSLDLVVLPHVLEFTQDPHQVLREVDRVLRPEGRLIVTGFNPVSLWGARQLAPGWLLRPFLPRDEHFIAVPRLRDWCKLLSFETERARYGCYRPPCRTQLWLDRTRFLERMGDRWWPICGAVYVVSAVKRVRGMRLIGPAWKRGARARAIAVPSAQRRRLPDDRPPG
jgi:SAM-dependent methyltransferase